MYNPETGNRCKVRKMMLDRRIRYYAPVDYSEGSGLEELLKKINRRTAFNEVLEKIHLACERETERAR